MSEKACLQEANKILKWQVMGLEIVGMIFWMFEDGDEVVAGRKEKCLVCSYS